MSIRDLALTTGQAARCCLVSPDTIVNWIKAGHLSAQRTAGGQFRIRVEDLRDFMTTRGMNTRELDPQPVPQPTQTTRPMCWQFFQGQNGSPDPSRHCAGCLVEHLGVRDCYKLMGMRPEADQADRDCENCPYYQRFGEPIDLH